MLIGDYDSFVVHAVWVNMNEMNEVNVDGMDPRMLVLRKMETRPLSDRHFKSDFGCSLAPMASSSGGIAGATTKTRLKVGSSERIRYFIPFSTPSEGNKGPSRENRYKAN